MTSNLPYQFPFLLGDSPGVVDFDLTLEQQCEAIWDYTRDLRRVEDSIRKEPPLLRVWDAEMNLQFILGNENRASFSFISNDTGPGQTEVPEETPVSKWIQDETGRIARGEGRNVVITVDYCGARWSGIMDKFTVETRDDGDRVLIIDWLHDYEHLKWVSIWPNPFLPAAFQFPRAFLAAGPVDWVLKLALFLNGGFREHFPLLTWPDDPLDLSEWFTGLDQSNWHMVVAPKGFLDAMGSGIVWGILISRMGNWHDASHIMLEDAELSVRCDRYLNGDPPPWEGADLRHGTLVIDIVDKSGVYIGTSHGGSIFDGLIRTVVEFGDDFIDSTENIISDTTITEYDQGGTKFTHKERPYVVFREGETSPIQSAKYINSPAKGVQVVCGGHSMPGINEGISATIQAIGDIIGNLAQIGSLGGSIDTLLRPLYEDTVLAWWAVKNSARAQHSGWERLFEYFQDVGQSGGSKAYTIASLMVLRAGFWATKTTVSWRINAIDGLPFMVGDRGLGHFFLDDRIGLVLKADDKIHVDRCRKIDLAWDPDMPPEWQLTVGDDRIFQDPASRAWGKIEQLVAGMRDLGLW